MKVALLTCIALLNGTADPTLLKILKAYDALVVAAKKTSVGSQELYVMLGAGDVEVEKYFEVPDGGAAELTPVREGFRRLGVHAVKVVSDRDGLKNMLREILKRHLKNAHAERVIQDKLIDTRETLRDLTRDIPAPPELRSLMQRSGSMVAANFTGELWIWGMPTGSRRFVLKLSKFSLNAVALSNDGLLAGAAGGAGSTALVDVAKGKVVGVLRQGTNTVASLSFSSDKEYTVTGTGGGEVLVWKTAERRALRDLSQVGPAKLELGGRNTPSKTISSVVIAPNDKFVAAASLEGWVRLWDFKTGEFLRELEAHFLPAKSLTISPDSKLIVSVNDRNARIYDARTGRSAGESMQAETQIVSLAISPDQKFIFGGLFNGAVWIWNLDTQKFYTKFVPHQGPVYEIHVSSDGQSLITGGSDKILRIWNLEYLLGTGAGG